MNMSEWKTFKELEMEKVRTFNVINKAFLSVQNIDKIHPLKQKKVFNLVNNINCNEIKRVWIFGSSTNNSCNIHSDIDVLIELNPDIDLVNDEDVLCRIHRNFLKSLGTDYDSVFLNDLNKDKQIYKSIMKTRRLVYERND